VITAWILVSVLLGGAIAIGAMALDGACRSLRVPTRWGWSAALTLLVLLTILVPFRRTPHAGALSIPAALAATATNAGHHPAASMSTVAQAMSVARAVVDASIARLTSVVVLAVPPAVDRWLLIAWIGSSVLLLIGGALVFRRLLRAHRTWPVALLHGERVHVAPDAGPAVLGFARGVIVVPRWLAECATDVQQIVVAHEREHLRARDPILLTAGAVAVMLLPWNPAAWWMLARLRLAVELDCDRRVLDGGVRTRDYGALLIDLAGRTAGITLGTPLVGLTMLAERTTHLERRIFAMSAPRPRLAALRIAAGSLVALVAALAACESRLPTSVDVDNMTATSAERAAAKAGITSGSDSLTTYYIDGYVAGSDAAHALPANRITSVRVVRDTANRAKGSVWITTRDTAARVARSTSTPDTAAAPRVVRAVTIRDEAHHVTIHADSTSHFAGLMFVDGKRIEPSALSTISRSDIASVEVIKGERAAALYPNEPAAAQGVIQITTKHAP
jgi:beta-lactamase regulating signal transducer with metallopeptidase domain